MDFVLTVCGLVRPPPLPPLPAVVFLSPPTILPAAAAVGRTVPLFHKGDTHSAPPPKLLFSDYEAAVPALRAVNVSKLPCREVVLPPLSILPNAPDMKSTHDIRMGQFELRQRHVDLPIDGLGRYVRYGGQGCGRFLWRQSAVLLMLQLPR